MNRTTVNGTPIPEYVQHVVEGPNGRFYGMYWMDDQYRRAANMPGEWYINTTAGMANVGTIWTVVAFAPPYTDAIHWIAQQTER